MARSVVEGFRQVVARMEGSGQYKLVQEFYPPLPLEDVEFLEEHIRELSDDETFRIWRPRPLVLDVTAEPDLGLLDLA